MSGPICTDASWGLSKQADDGTPGRPLDGLHEIILDSELIASLDTQDD